MMSWKRTRSLILISLVCFLSFSVYISPARGAVNILASPIQAGCYIAQHDTCKIHADPFTINITPGEKLVYFQLLATRISSGSQRVIYDFHTDQSNPAPLLGSTYAPDLVKKDFAAICGQQYIVTLEGQDTGDTVPSVLGNTGVITCPTGNYLISLPLIRK